MLMNNAKLRTDVNVKYRVNNILCKITSVYIGLDWR